MRILLACDSGIASRTSMVCGHLKPAMRARYVSSFNSGYRAFSGGYSACTESAYAAIGRYMKEGQELSRDTAVRFGN